MVPIIHSRGVCIKIGWVLEEITELWLDLEFGFCCPFSQENVNNYATKQQIVVRANRPEEETLLYNTTNLW